MHTLHILLLGVYVSIMELAEGVVGKLESLIARCSGIQQMGKEWKYEGKWLRAGHIHYASPEGEERVWETSERTTQPFGKADGTDVIAITPDHKSITLVAVYRPPVDMVSIEFPAGLLDGDESFEKGALRELREETGKHGTVKTVGSVVYCDPWKSTESTVPCEVMLEDKPAEKLSLDSDELLVPFELPLKNLSSQLNLLQKRFKVSIEAKLYFFAMGMKIQNSISQQHEQ